MQVLPTLSLSH